MNPQINPSAMPQFESVIVTPEIAKTYLLASKGNRPLKKEKIKLYAKLMLEGKWRFANDAICFDIDGRLINGHNRLNAVIMANISVPMTIGRGFERDTIYVMDTGTVRGGSDTLSFVGASNSNNMAAAIRQVLYYDLGGRKTNLVTNNDIVEHYLANQEYWDNINNSAFRIVCSNQSALHAAKYLLARYHDKVIVDHFFNVLDSGIVENDNDKSIILLRESFLKWRMNTKKGYLSSLIYIHKTIQVFGMWRNGQSVSKVQLIPRGDAMIALYSARTLRPVKQTQP